MRLRAAFSLLVLLGHPAHADVDLEHVADIEDIESLSLNELLEQPVTSASRYAQKPGGSPILVSTIDEELIQAMGYRTLSDALGGMRGVYTTNDRNYSYLGTRGFSLPGDYNTRYSLSIDNHRMNDPVYGNGNIGGELALPMLAVERVEMIRGGAWSVHGESALLGAIQVVTASGATRPGIQVTTTARANVESFEDPANRSKIETRGQDINASYGVVRGGYDVFVAGSYAYDPGLSAIYFPQFDGSDQVCVGENHQPRACDGIVRNADGEEIGSVFAAIKKRNLAFRTFAGIRKKESPTASFDSNFGDKVTTRDSRFYGDLEYKRSSDRGDLVLRLTGDHYDYVGSYPYIYEPEVPTATSSLLLGFNDDGAEATWWGAEARGRLKRERFGRYLSDLEIGGGAEARRATGRQFNSDVIAGERVPRFERTDPADRAAIFGHASGRAFDRVVGFVAGRGDYYVDSVGMVFNPQLGVVLDGGELGRIRASLSRGHRSPNIYEQYFATLYDGVQTAPLKPEKSETREISLEHYLNQHVRLLVVGFRQEVTDLITLDDSADSNTTFTNIGGLTSTGVEAELEGRWDKFRLRTNYTRVRARTSDGEVPANSPKSLANLTLLIPFASDRGLVGIESAYVNKRTSADGTELPPVFSTNAAVTIKRVVDNLDLTLGITNLFDQRTGNPSSVEHRVSVIPQDPRVFWARLRLELP